MEVVISRSSKPDKRLKAKFASKTVHFGSKTGSTFVDHGNNQTKKAWIARHRVRENWEDYDSAGALAKHVLWNKTTMKASIANLNSMQSQYRFKLG